MGKDSKQQEDDILDEKYKGPNELVAVAGEAYYAHWWMAFVGTAAGAAIAMVFPKQSSQTVQRLRGVAEKWHESGSKFQKWTSSAIHGVFGTGAEYAEFKAAKVGLKESREKLDNANPILEGLDKHLVYKEKGFGFWLFDHTFGMIPPIKKWAMTATNFKDKTGAAKDNAEIVSNAITSGGLLGVLGFTVVPWFYSFFEGAGAVDRGKKQFKRAQSEIQELREDLEFMEKRNEELRGELRTMRDEPIRVTRDEPPIVKNDIDEPTTSLDTATIPKRKDDHAAEATSSHASRHAVTAGKSHSEQVLAKSDAEQIAIGA
ncbi:MAG: hypothetical protein J0M34_08800 [Alphaproteobacteria bacterium]|nr:hypothetical protein [Alphaproteobacteria bacterium]